MDLRVEQCKKCGAVCCRIHTQISTVLADVKPGLIHKSVGGSEVGYTPDGRRIEGWWIDPSKPHLGGYEAHRQHSCASSKFSSSQP
jgi:hypothetical protein